MVIVTSTVMTTVLVGLLFDVVLSMLNELEDRSIDGVTGLPTDELDGVMRVSEARLGD